MSAIVGGWIALPDLGSTIAISVNGGADQFGTVTYAGAPVLYPTGDGGNQDLLGRLQDGIRDHSSLNTGNLFVERFGDNLIRIRTTGVNVQINSWGDFPFELLGLPPAPTISSTQIVGNRTCPLIWLPGGQPSNDTFDRQVIGQARTATWDGFVQTVRFPSARKRRAFDFEYVERTRALVLFGETTTTAFETLDRESLSFGRPFRYYEDAGDIGSGSGFQEYVLEEPAELRQVQAARWEVMLRMRQWLG